MRKWRQIDKMEYLMKDEGCPRCGYEKKASDYMDAGIPTISTGSSYDFSGLSSRAVSYNSNPGSGSSKDSYSGVKGGSSGKK